MNSMSVALESALLHPRPRFMFAAVRIVAVAILTVVLTGIVIISAFHMIS